jgi:hypothetical protein
MWIIPKNLDCSHSAQATEDWILELSELAEVCSQSLMWRSSVSPSRTWLQRWKRVNWLQHLSGRILKPSQQKSFVDAWTSSLRDTLASRFPTQDSGKEATTQDTYGHSYRGQLQLFDLDASSLRMSKDILPTGLKTCCGTWENWVTKLRADCSQRLNAARLTNESESSSLDSFLTPAATDYKGSGQTGEGRDRLDYAVERGITKHHGPLDQASTSTHGNHPEQFPTPRATDCSKGGPNQAGSKGDLMLPSAVNQWQTPATDSFRSRGGDRKHEMGLDQQAKQWLTPRANEPCEKPGQVAARLKDRGSHCHGSLSAQAKWATPRTKYADGWVMNKARQESKPEDTLVGMACDSANIEKFGPNKGKLNPRWVETLQGIPVGWTMPSCVCPVTPGSTSCASAATESCQQQQNEHSEH